MWKVSYQRYPRQWCSSLHPYVVSMVLVGTCTGSISEYRHIKSAWVGTYWYEKMHLLVKHALKTGRGAQQQNSCLWDLSVHCLAWYPPGFNSVFVGCVPWSTSCSKYMRKSLKFYRIWQWPFAQAAKFVNKDTISPVSEGFHMVVFES